MLLRPPVARQGKNIKGILVCDDTVQLTSGKVFATATERARLHTPNIDAPASLFAHSRY